MEESNVGCNPTNASSVDEPEFVITTVVLGFINVSVVFGNSLVVAAVFTSRKLRTVTNMFIVSLAVADLLLGVVILPFSIAYEVLDYWIFGTFMCTIWLAVDVWLSTASILNLCAISLDRYLAITEPIKYPNLMCPRRARLLIASVWALAFVVCLPPLIGWTDPGTNVSDSIINNVSDSFLLQFLSYNFWNFTENNTDMIIPGNPAEKCLEEVLPLCQLVSERGYRIYSAMGSFYIPMLVMMFFYLRIYLAAVRTAASLRKGVLTTRKHDDTHTSSDNIVTLRIHRGTSSRQFLRNECSVSNAKNSSENSDGHQNNFEKTKEQSKIKTERDGLLLQQKNKATRHINSVVSLNRPAKSDFSSVSVSSKDYNQEESNELRVDQKPRKYKENNHLVPENELRNRGSNFPSKGARKKNPIHIRKFKRETKAAKTLAIIVGAFILCWLPFFSVYLIGAFCEDCIPPLLFSCLFWLGYCNSAINPCVYAMFSRDFRQAFKRLMCYSEGRNKTKEEKEHQPYGKGVVQLQLQTKDNESLTES